ncbi:hypothetical protein ACH5RR_035468 [Cinchona calisaya]|uniref:Transcription and mRNA export factor ENY2 n=1 Tax=Cinchona calisaya TaxID=153742 RepID=A0ABD2Y5E8_9GENT
MYEVKHLLLEVEAFDYSYSSKLYHRPSSSAYQLPYCSIMRSSVKRPPTPDVEEEEQDRQPTLQEIINIKLIESGEKERLKELLRERLMECGWKDEMKAICRAFARKKGRNNVTVDDLVHVITPKGRASIPDSVKAELLQRIRSFLTSTAL